MSFVEFENMEAESNLARVEDDFALEYPGADPASSEAFVNVVRVGDRLDTEVSRRLRAQVGISLRAFSLLVTVDGLGGQATSAVIATHLPITTAAITSLVDTCEKRGWVVRIPDGQDRRKTQIAMTDAARELIDGLLPGAHQLERQVMSGLSKTEMSTLMRLLAKVQAGVSEAETEEPVFAEGVRNRPARLDPRAADTI